MAASHSINVEQLLREIDVKDHATRRALYEQDLLGLAITERYLDDFETERYPDCEEELSKLRRFQSSLRGKAHGLLRSIIHGDGLSEADATAIIEMSVAAIKSAIDDTQADCTNAA